MVQIKGLIVSGGGMRIISLMNAYIKLRNTASNIDIKIELEKAIKEIRPDELSPKEALDMLYKLKELQI